MLPMLYNKTSLYFMSVGDTEFLSIMLGLYLIVFSSQKMCYSLLYGHMVFDSHSSLE